MRRPFKAYNSLGKPLCPACGGNPRAVGRVRCGRCEREGRAIQWRRLPPETLAMLRTMGLTPPERPDQPSLFD